MKTPILTLAFGLLSFSAFADSDSPVCRGSFIPKHLRGNWVGADPEGNLVDEYLLKKNAFVTFDEEEGGDVVYRAWYCNRFEREFLVLDFGPEVEDGRYESRLIFTFQFDEDGEIQRPSNGEFPTYFFDMGEAYIGKEGGSEVLRILPMKTPVYYGRADDVHFLNRMLRKQKEAAEGQGK